MSACPPSYFPPAYVSVCPSALLDADADTELPAYDAAATLDPWLRLLRRPHWETRGLSLFLAPEDADDSDSDVASTSEHGAPRMQHWHDEYAQLVTDLIEAGLPLDPCEEVQYDYMFGSVAPEVLDYIHTEIPAELRNAALTFAVQAKRPEPVRLNPLFTDALARHAQDVAASLHFDMSHTSTLPTALPPSSRWLLASGVLPSQLFPLHLTRLAPSDLAALAKALFLLQCRARFAARARAAIADRANSVVYRVLAGVVKMGKWKHREPAAPAHPKDVLAQPSGRYAQRHERHARSASH